MPNLLEELENNEAVLLMYLAGELPEEDQAEVDQMLTTDVRLAAELERLRASLADSDALMNSADAHTRLPVAEEVAVRNTLRRMRQWQLEHPYVPQTAPVARGLAYPWWAYPTSAAAMLLLAAIVWWGIRPDAMPNEFVRNTAVPFVESTDPTASPDAETRSQAFAYADPLDKAYLELRSIQELADGL